MRSLKGVRTEYIEGPSLTWTLPRKPAPLIHFGIYFTMLRCRSRSLNTISLSLSLCLCLSLSLSLPLSSPARSLALPTFECIHAHAYDGPTLAACFKAHRLKAPGSRPWATLAEEIPPQPPGGEKWQPYRAEANKYTEEKKGAFDQADGKVK